MLVKLPVNTNEDYSSCKIGSEKFTREVFFYFLLQHCVIAPQVRLFSKIRQINAPEVRIPKATNPTPHHPHATSHIHKLFNRIPAAL